MNDLTISEKLRVLMQRQNMTVTSLADAIGMTRQNLSNKFSRNSFSYADVKSILTALGYHIEFIADKNNFKNVKQILDK